MKDKIVYVVEDNASDFKFVKRALKKAGVDGENISHITNGEHVLRLLNGTNLLPDLIMLDIEMKPDGIDGLEVLREIRSDVKLSSIKVAVMSG
jgi:CheY-like chemotaxis protein